MTDLSKRQSDYAVYLPAISSFYTKQLEKVLREVDSRVPAGFEKGYNGLDFLDPNGYFHYNKGLDRKQDNYYGIIYYHTGI